MAQEVSRKISAWPEVTETSAEIYVPATTAVLGVPTTVKLTRAQLVGDLGASEQGAVPGIATAEQAALNTAAIQRQLDIAARNYLAGSGPTTVTIAPGTYTLGASTSTETFWNYGDPVLATTGCLSIKPGTRLATQGCVVLRPASPSLDVIHLVDGTDVCIDGIEIDGGWSASGAGHAILQVTSADNTTTSVENLVIRNVYAHDVGSYGVGLENGVFTNCLVENLRTKNTGADGIDIKNRPYPTNDSKGIVLSNINVENPGRRLDGQTGIDIRGLAHATALTVVGVGRSGVQMSGIRLRTAGTDAGWCERSTVTGFYVRGTSSAMASTLGVDVGSSDCAITGGTVDDCQEGVSIGGNGTEAANRNVVTGVSVRSANTRAFVILTGAERNKLIGCSAKDGLLGVRNQGDYTVRVGFTHDNCVTVYSTSSGALTTENTAADQSTTGDFAVLGSAAVGRCNVTAAGASTNIDIHLETKGTGVVRFGTRTALAAETLSGYIEIRDTGGVVRKLAVIS